MRAAKEAKKPEKPKKAASRRSTKQGTTRELVVEGTVLAASNVDRIVFPDSGITKGDVLEYYRDVGPMMVPHLRGRAITLERFTKGIAGGGFFQKHFQKHYPPTIDRFPMGSKTVVEYPMCNDVASLVYFANQGGLAFHVGTDRKETAGHPDQVVFDLDPPEGRFDLARQAALAVRAVLEDAGLTAFVKTTGSKGLHVVAPLDASADYERVHRFLVEASGQLCAAHPDLLTMEFYKKDRKGRLFLDVMRNTLGATVIAPYSLRGKPGAPVSTPIAWEEVEDPALTPDGIGLRNLRQRLDARGDPWATIETSRARL